MLFLELSRVMISLSGAKRFTISCARIFAKATPPTGGGKGPMNAIFLAKVKFAF